MNEKMLNTVLFGDCLNKLKEIESASIDSIITDPPYQLSEINTQKQSFAEQLKHGRTKEQKKTRSGFLGKKWDVLPPVETWKECLRVLKPGAFAFIMTTPRQDSLCKLITDLTSAGFNMGFSSMYWSYSCLTDDTEILAKNYGWLPMKKSNISLLINKGEEILIYDKQKDKYRWEIPQRWSIYKIKDTIYRIKSDYTDQCVTKNHNCIVKQDGKILLQKSETLGQTVNVPYLEDMSNLSNTISNISVCNNKKKKEGMESNILQWNMQWKSTNTTKNSLVKKTRLVEKTLVI
jgi:DNA modification methylase